jgi:hypothetical protein
MTKAVVTDAEVDAAMRALGLHVAHAVFRSTRTPKIFPCGLWLVAKGYAMPVATSEVHIGGYGRWSKEFGVNLPHT